MGLDVGPVLRVRGLRRLEGDIDVRVPGRDAVVFGVGLSADKLVLAALDHVLEVNLVAHEAVGESVSVLYVVIEIVYEAVNVALQLGKGWLTGFGMKLVSVSVSSRCTVVGHLRTIAVER